MEACRACCAPRFWSGLRARLEAPPPDGGLWSSRKVAAWMAGELGLAEVSPQRGWEALEAIGWSVQKPRPAHPARPFNSPSQSKTENYNLLISLNSFSAGHSGIRPVEA